MYKINKATFDDLSDLFLQSICITKISISTNKCLVQIPLMISDVKFCFNQSCSFSERRFFLYIFSQNRYQKHNKTDRPIIFHTGIQFDFNRLRFLRRLFLYISYYLLLYRCSHLYHLTPLLVLDPIYLQQAPSIYKLDEQHGAKYNSQNEQLTNEIVWFVSSNTTMIHSQKRKGMMTCILNSSKDGGCSLIFPFPFSPLF